MDCRGCESRAWRGAFRQNLLLQTTHVPSPQNSAPVSPTRPEQKAREPLRSDRPKLGVFAKGPFERKEEKQKTPLSIKRERSLPSANPFSHRQVASKPKEKRPTSSGRFDHPAREQPKVPKRKSTLLM